MGRKLGSPIVRPFVRVGAPCTYLDVLTSARNRSQQMDGDRFEVDTGDRYSSIGETSFTAGPSSFSVVQIS